MHQLSILLNLTQIKILLDFFHEVPPLAFPLFIISVYCKLKVPKYEILDRSDFHDFYTMKVTLGLKYKIII